MTRRRSSFSLSLSLLLSSLSSVGVVLSEPHLDAEIGSNAKSSSSSRRAAAANVSQHHFRAADHLRRRGAPRPVDPLKLRYWMGSRAQDYDSEKLIADRIECRATGESSSRTYETLLALVPRNSIDVCFDIELHGSGFPGSKFSHARRMMEDKYRGTFDRF